MLVIEVYDSARLQENKKTKVLENINHIFQYNFFDMIRKNSIGTVSSSKRLLSFQNNFL